MQSFVTKKGGYMMRKGMKKGICWILIFAMIVVLSPDLVCQAAETAWEIVLNPETPLDSVYFYDEDESKDTGYFYGYKDGKVTVMDKEYTIVKETEYTTLISDAYMEIDGEPVIEVEKDGLYGLMSATGEEVVAPTDQSFGMAYDESYVEQHYTYLPEVSLNEDCADDFDWDDFDWDDFYYEHYYDPDEDDDEENWSYDDDWRDYDYQEFLIMYNSARNADGNWEHWLYDWNRKIRIKQVVPEIDPNGWDYVESGYHYVGSYDGYRVIRRLKVYRNWGSYLEGDVHNDYVIYDMDNGEMAYDTEKNGYVWADEENKRLVVFEDKEKKTSESVVSPGTAEIPVVSSNAAASPNVSPSTTPKPTATPSNTPKVSSTPTATPKVSSKPTASPKATKDSEDSDDDSSKTKKSSTAKKGTVFSHQGSNGKYLITNRNGERTVTYLSPLSKNRATVKIPATVTYKGKSYKVTAVGNQALSNNKSLTYLSLGKNIKNIGKRAFANCTSLRYIMVKTDILSGNNVGRNAFAGTSDKIRVKSSKERWKRYDVAFRREGLSERAIFVINPVPLKI
jgi:hypothetical protein